MNKKKLEYYGTRSAITVITFAILISITNFDEQFSDAYGPNDPECFEQPDQEDCPSFFDAPFDRMIDPFNATLADFTFVAIWGIIIGILWLRVSNPMMVAVTGVALAALFTRPDVAGNLTGFSEEAQAVGWGLLILSVVVAVYQILTVRINFPTN